MKMAQLSDIDLQTLRTELESGIRLSSPIYCPHTIWKLMQSCWKSNPDTRPSFKQLKTSLWQDMYFPKTSDNIKEEDTIYQAILGDTSMKMKYNAICHNNTVYLDMKKQSSPDVTDALDTNSSRFVQDGSADQTPKKETPKRNTMAVYVKEEEMPINSNDGVETIEFQDLTNQCTNNTYLSPNVILRRSINHERKLESSYPDVVEDILMEHAQNTQDGSGELSMLIKYNTLPHKKENKQNSNITHQDGNLKYATTSKSYETIFNEAKYQTCHKLNHPNSNTTGNINKAFGSMSNFRCPSKRKFDITDDEAKNNETAVDMNYSSGHIDKGEFIWKEGEDRNGLDEDQVYNLNRKRIRSCDTPSTQYTGVDLDDGSAVLLDSKYHQTKLLNRMKSLEEVEENAFIEFDVTGFA